MMLLRSLLIVGLAFLGSAWTRPAQSADLKIGIGTAFTSLDPHFYVATSNIMISRYIFDALVSTDERQRPLPALALSWKALDEHNWEFRLRPNVVFSDGSPFTADDVVASLARAPNVKGSPSSFALYTRSIKAVHVKDPLTLVIETSYPNPTLPVEMSYIAVISKKYERASPSDFNSLEAMLGTGPFVVKEYVPNDRVVLARNDKHWGRKPAWENVTVRLIANNGARTAALLAGDVDVIDSVPPADIGRIESEGYRVVTAVSNRVIFIGLDQDRETSPFAKNAAGKNPLQDVRVRRALSLAINRGAIADRIMNKQAVPAGQFLPKGFFGVSPRLNTPKFDAAAAKALLKEAGAEGIRLTLHGPSDRYLNASQVLQSIAQMFDRIGVKADVEMLPWNTYVTRLVERNVSVFLAGWGSVTGETGVSMLVTVATFDAAKGAGGGNRGRYSNKEVDATLGLAMRTMDNAERDKLLAKASEIAIDDGGIIPLYFEVTGWALRKGLKMTGRSDQATLAAEILPQ